MDTYQRMAELADAATWFRQDQTVAEGHLVQLTAQTPTTPLDWWHLRRLRADNSRRAALAGRLAAHAEAEHQLLAQTLPETAREIEPPEPTDTRAELLSRFTDAVNAQGAALAEADRQFEKAQRVWPWQRTRSEIAFLRGRYADTCARAHADAARRARRGLDAVTRDRLPRT